MVLGDLSPQALAIGIADTADRQYDRRAVAASVEMFTGSAVAAQVERLLESVARATRA